MSTVIQVPGRGAMDLSAYRVNKAVHEYDERLIADRNPKTGVDTVFIEMARDTEWADDDGVAINGSRYMPIIGFPEGFPESDVVLKRLYEADASRHGSNILNWMNRRNDALLEPVRHAASESAGETADVMESVMHREGKTRYHRSLPKEDPKQKVSTANKSKRNHGR